MRQRADKPAATVRRVHPHAWLWEPLTDDPTFVLRSMFGAKAAYLGGKLMLCFCARAEPWRGVLACTDRTRHGALVSEFPELSPHPILPKWLYLPETADSFERVATRLVALARRRDPRLGVTPQPGKPRRAQPKRFLQGSS
ncbi:MAG: hypothetical protein HZA93_10495 [Verrucomicrobia bacterium]|nr:hypothetical protein [Verrucomicrobiota bacterium]